MILRIALILCLHAVVQSRAQRERASVLVQPAAYGGSLTKVPEEADIWHLKLHGLDNSSTKFYGANDRFISASHLDNKDDVFIRKEEFDIDGPRFALLFAGNGNLGIDNSTSILTSSLISLELLNEVPTSPDDLNLLTSITYVVKLGKTAITSRGNLTKLVEFSGFDKAVLIIDMQNGDYRDGKSSANEGDVANSSLRDDESAIAANFLRRAQSAANDDIVSAQGPLFGPLTLWCCPACFIGCPVEILIPALWGMVAFKNICCVF